MLKRARNVVACFTHRLLFYTVLFEIQLALPGTMSFQQKKKKYVDPSVTEQEPGFGAP